MMRLIWSLLRRRSCPIQNQIHPYGRSLIDIGTRTDRCKSSLPRRRNPRWIPCPHCIMMMMLLPSTRTNVHCDKVKTRPPRCRPFEDVSFKDYYHLHPTSHRRIDTVILIQSKYSPTPACYRKRSSHHVYVAVDSRSPPVRRPHPNVGGRRPPPRSRPWRSIPKWMWWCIDDRWNTMPPRDGVTFLLDKLLYLLLFGTLSNSFFKY